MHLFYQTNPFQSFLEKEEALHCIKVLRQRPGSTIGVIDGKGTLIKGVVSTIDRKTVSYNIVEVMKFDPPENSLNMAICPTRKAERNEWMVEKMTEVGVQAIQFIVSDHTHHETLKRVVNIERLNRIALSAMKQSQQYFLPEINIFHSFDAYLAQVVTPERYIAYVSEDNSTPHLFEKVTGTQSVHILIGPEGDFTDNEIEKAVNAGFEPISLGTTRLRTETAALIACHTANLAKFRKF